MVKFLKTLKDTFSSKEEESLAPPTPPAHTSTPPPPKPPSHAPTPSTKPHESIDHSVAKEFEKPLHEQQNTTQTVSSPPPSTNTTNSTTSHENVNHSVAKELEKQPPKQQTAPKPATPTKLAPASKQESNPSATLRAVQEILSLPRIDETPYREAAAPTTAKEPFHLHQGGVIHDTQELAQALSTMSQEVFLHHVNNEKNDFAEWVQHSVQDQELADKIRSATSQEAIQEVLQETATPSKQEENLPSLTQEKTPLAKQVTKQLSKLREEIHAEIDSASKRLEEQSTRLETLQEDVRQAKQELHEQEQALKQERQKMRDEQEALAKELQEVHEQTTRLQQKKHSASQARKQLSNLHTDTPKQDDSLSQAQQVVQAHINNQQPTNKTSSPEATVREHIQTVRKHIQQANWPSAKSSYTQAREAFYQANMPDEKRKELYNLLRGLYTDIHLQASE